MTTLNLDGIILNPCSSDPSSPSEGELLFADGTTREKDLWILKDSIFQKISHRYFPITLSNNNLSSNSGAVEEYEFDRKVFKFSIGLEQKNKNRFFVPNDYVKGQLKLLINCYSESVDKNFRFESKSTLIKSEGSAVNSSTNQRISTNSLIANSTTQYLLRSVILDITDSNSKINNISVAANDLITIEIYRDDIIMDCDLNDLRLIQQAQIIKV